MDSLLRHLPALHETVFRLSIALVATLVAVCALSLSLLGPALAVAGASVARSRKRIAERIAWLQSGVRANCTPDQQLCEMEREVREYQAALKAVRQTSRRISVRGAVLYPGGFFICAAILSKMAGNASVPPARSSPAGLLVLVPFLIGIALLVRALSSFRTVTRLSLPDLDLTDDAGSTAWEVGKCSRLRIRAFLHKGMALRSVQIILLVPPTCKLTKSVPLWTMPADDPLTPGYYVLGSRVRDVRMWAPMEWVIDDLQPTVAGRLQLYYAVEGHAYSTALQLVQVEAH